MFEGSTDTQIEPSGVRRARWRHGRPVRLALITWPVAGLLGATVATAACLFGECKGHAQPQPKETLFGYGGTIRSLAFRPDGGVLSSIGLDGSFLLWNLEGRPRPAFPPTGPDLVRSAAFSPDGKVLAVANGSTTVTLAELGVHPSRSLQDESAGSAGAACVAFAPDGATLAVGQQDGKITLWDVATGRHQSTLCGHSDFVASLSFAPDGRALASSGGDRVLRIWDMPSGRERLSIQSPMTTFVALSFSPDGRLLALSDQVSPVVRLWDVTAGRERARLRGASSAVLTAAISPDSATLAAADFKGFVTFWDLDTLTIRPKRLRHAGVHALAFAPDGRTLATGGFDGAIYLWEFPFSAPTERFAPAIAANR
jgi:WD40 repeat protein